MRQKLSELSYRLSPLIGRLAPVKSKAADGVNFVKNAPRKYTIPAGVIAVLLVMVIVRGVIVQNANQTGPLADGSHGGSGESVDLTANGEVAGASTEPGGFFNFFNRNNTPTPKPNATTTVTPNTGGTGSSNTSSNNTSSNNSSATATPTSNNSNNNNNSTATPTPTSAATATPTPVGATPTPGATATPAPSSSNDPHAGQHQCTNGPLSVWIPNSMDCSQVVWPSAPGTPGATPTPPATPAPPTPQPTPEPTPAPSA